VAGEGILSDRAVGYLQKPFAPLELAAKVRDMLRS
jgi:DNA-binding response OmpR family regulator